MSFRRSCLVLAALISMAGCRDAAEPQPSITSVSRTASGLRITNSESRAMGYIAFEAEFATLVEWIPCREPTAGCLRIPPHSSVTVPYLDVPGYKPGAQEAVVYTWHLRRDAAGAYLVDEMQSWRVAF